MIDVAIVDENGAVRRQLTDKALLASNEALAEHGSDPDFCCLRFVDPYGDTTFNLLQVEALSQELSSVAERIEAPESRAAIEEVFALVEEVRAGVHLYLKFLGD